jgi:hypothetical protein
MMMIVTSLVFLLALAVPATSSYSLLVPSECYGGRPPRVSPPPEGSPPPPAFSLLKKSQQRGHRSALGRLARAHRGGGDLQPRDPPKAAAVVADPQVEAPEARAGAAPETAAAPPSKGAVLDAQQLDRIRIRLDGLGTYAMVSALLVGGILGVYFNTPKAFVEGRFVDNAVTALFLASSAASLVASVYVTLTFSLVGLYSKTALGLGRDGPCADFLDATRRERACAYDAFLLSLALFQSSFVMNMFLAVQGPARWAAAGAAGLLVALSSRSVLSVLKAASRFVFSDD